jgi:hypothetical protein
LTYLQPYTPVAIVLALQPLPNFSEEGKNFARSAAAEAILKKIKSLPLCVQ